MSNIIEARIEYAKEIIEHLHKVSDETNFLISDSSERNLDIKKEGEFLQNIQHLILEKMFLYETDGKIVGICSIKGVNKKRVKHRVDFAVSVLKEYWGQGIAKKLMNHAINYCRENNIKKIELYVRVDNERALKLYKNFGFEIEGEIKNFIFIDDTYYNAYIMSLFI